MHKSVPIMLSMCRAGFLHRDAEATDRPNAHPMCVLLCVRMGVVDGRCFVLILADAPSL